MVLDALFYRLRNAGPWRDLPEGFGPWRTIAALRTEVLDLALLAVLKHAAGVRAEPLFPLRDLHGVDVEVFGDLLHCLDPFEGF